MQFPVLRKAKLSIRSSIKFKRSPFGNNMFIVISDLNAKLDSATSCYRKLRKSLALVTFVRKVEIG